MHGLTRLVDVAELPAAELISDAARHTMTGCRQWPGHRRQQPGGAEPTAVTVRGAPFIRTSSTPTCEEIPPRQNAPGRADSTEGTGPVYGG